MIIPLLLGVAAAVFIFQTVWTGLRSPLKDVPGPWYAKFTNIPYKLAIVTGRRIHFVHALHEKYGPYVCVTPDQVAVNDPAAYKLIHGVASGFGKSTWYEAATSLGRITLFTYPDNKSHSLRRRMFAQSCSKSNIRQHWEDTIREKISTAVTKMQEDSSSNGSADVLKWWTLMASDVASHLSFGESFHTLEQGEINDFIKILLKALQGNGIGAELPPVRAIGKRLPFEATQQLFNTSDSLKSYAAKALEAIRSGEESNSIFGKIQAEADKEKGSVDNQDVELEAIAMFIAGTDTTAVTLTYLLWAVLSRPDLARQLAAEACSLPETYSDADVEPLPLVNAVINETLRLYGAVPGGLPRIVPDGGAQMGGFAFPPGTTVSTQSYSMHRDADLFPAPLEFQVGRWMPEDANFPGARVSDAAKAVFSPFGSGPRSCLGVHIAWMELRLAVVEFFRRYGSSQLAPTVTPESMYMENFFSIVPVSHQCNVVVA